MALRTPTSMIDTHTHIFSQEFDADRPQVVERAVRAGVSAMLLPNEDAGSLGRLQRTVADYPAVCHALVGLHPTSVGADYPDQLDRIFSASAGIDSPVGIGEIGLDLYWDASAIGLQTEALEAQLSMAAERGLPVSVHCRDAMEPMLEVLGRFGRGRLRGVMHCFSGTEADAARIVALQPDFLFGVGGVLTFRKSTLPGVVAALGLDRIVLETDAPYLAPVPMRGRRNEPAFIAHVRDALAAICGCSPDEVDRRTTDNALQMFNLPNSENT